MLNITKGLLLFALLSWTPLQATVVVFGEDFESYQAGTHVVGAGNGLTSLTTPASGAGTWSFTGFGASTNAQVVERTGKDGNLTNVLAMHDSSGSSRACMSMILDSYDPGPMTLSYDFQITSYAAGKSYYHVLYGFADSQTVMGTRVVTRSTTDGTAKIAALGYVEGTFSEIFATGWDLINTNQWYTAVYEMDSIPENGGAFTYNVKLYNANGVEILNEVDVPCYAGVDAIGQITRLDLGTSGASQLSSIMIDNLSVTVVPEPASLSLLVLGIFAVLRKRQ